MSDAKLGQTTPKFYIQPDLPRLVNHTRELMNCAGEVYSVQHNVFGLLINANYIYKESDLKQVFLFS